MVACYNTAAMLGRIIYHHHSTKITGPARGEGCTEAGQVSEKARYDHCDTNNGDQKRVRPVCSISSSTILSRGTYPPHSFLLIGIWCLASSLYCAQNLLFVTEVCVFMEYANYCSTFTEFQS